MRSLSPHLRLLIPSLLLLAGACAEQPDAPPVDEEPPPPGVDHLTVAISPDLPPYVLPGASGGIEVDILHLALPSRTLRFVQMPYADLQTAVPEGKADVSVAVQHFEDDGVFYSNEFVTFVNTAVSKKSAGLEIDSIADLAGHQVLTWQDAYLELGPDFEKLFAPGGPQHQNYVEIADQRQQVERFWEADDAVAVIDRNIFDYFSRDLGRDESALEFHQLFAPVTNFRVGFADEGMRDAFDDGLARLCASGEYDAILEQYQVEFPRTVCAAATGDTGGG